MLLVDDDQAEPIELDLLFDQRVRADDQVGVASVNESAVGPLAVLIERAGQQDDARLTAGALQ